MARLGRGYPSKPFIGRQLAPAGNTTLVFSTISWIWNKNTYSLASLVALTQKPWIWTKSFNLQQFINQVSKSWLWQGNIVTSWPSGIIKRFLMLLGFGS